MNKKFITLSITILLLSLIAFNTQPALSTSTSNFPRPSPPLNPPTNSEAINNSTIPTTSLTLVQTFEEQQLFWNFLNKVVGLDTNNYVIDQFRVLPEEINGSQKTQTAISATLSNDQTTLNIAMVIIEGKIRFYDLNIAAGTIKGPSLSDNDYLVASKNALNLYRTNFKADYCTDLVQIVPESLQTQTQTLVDNEKLLLTADYSKETDNQGKSVELIWYQKIGDLTASTLSVQVTFTETGLLTSFIDNLGVYKVATTKINLTEKDAIDLSLPLITEYADVNDRTVKSIDAELVYVSDYYSDRGDKFLVYPQWTVSAAFDNSNKEDIYGYSVLLWGDSGQIHSHGAQGTYQLLQNNITWSSYQYVLTLALITTVAAIGVVAYKRTKSSNIKPRYFIFKVGGILLAVSLCTLVVAQPVSAAPASILGSPYGVDPAEVICDNNFADDLTSWCSGVGYTAYNWYDSGTTRSNMYTAAYDHGELGSIVFHIGHGQETGIFTKNYEIYDKDGNWVSASDIYTNSVSQSIGHRKVAVIWSCEQGNNINGMPNAWLHTTSLSSNGYTSPDYSGQAFIGWNNLAPYLNAEHGKVNKAGDAFLREFYINALYRGFDLHNSLNFAAQTVWGKTFDNCVFYTGTGTGNMVVYGQGTMYIGYTAYPTSIYSYAYGYTGAGFINNINNLLGSQLDGQFAELHAGNYGDYAFVVTELNRQASGGVYLWANTGIGYYSHVKIYVSNNGVSWTTIGDGYILNETPGLIFCGSASNFRYVGVSALDDVGWSASVYVDSIHVST